MRPNQRQKRHHLPKPHPPTLSLYVVVVVVDVTAKRLIVLSTAVANPPKYHRGQINRHVEGSKASTTRNLMSRKRPQESLIKQLHVAGAGELTGMRGGRSFLPIKSHTLEDFHSKITDGLRISERERERSSRRFYRERFLTDRRKHATSITGCLIGCHVSDSGEESMAIVDSYHHQRHKSASDTKLFTLCPFWQSGGQTSSSSSSSTQNLHGYGFKSNPKTVSSVARSLLPPRRRLRLDPANKLYFPCMSSFPI